MPQKCIICDQEKTAAYVYINKRPVCTEDLMRLIYLAENLGLDRMRVVLHNHHQKHESS